MKNIRNRGSTLTVEDLRPKPGVARALSTHARNKQELHKEEADLLGDDRLSANDMEQEVGINMGHV